MDSLAQHPQYPQQAFRNASTQRTAFFNKLKPCCLEIVKALRTAGRRDTDPRDAAAAASTMVGTTELLYGILTEQVGYDASVLDASMADYAFFPLLPILENMRGYPARLVENATKCLRVLIQDGWKTGISKDNAQRLLILLTSVATGGQMSGGGGSSDKKTTNAPNVFLPEETVAEGYRALAALMRAAGAASSGPRLSGSPLVAANVVPVLAHAVTVMLEGVTDSIIPAIQTEALGGVEALYTTVKDLEALASFLPGTVSALVRVVAQPGAHKTPRRVVIRTLEVLFTVLVNTLGDLQTRRLRLEAKSTAGTTEAAVEEGDGNEDEVEAEIISSSVSAAQALRPPPNPPSTTTAQKPKLDAAWLKATAAQVKIALTTVLKLRNHESEDVRDAVQQFCVGLLDECHTSLSECTSILVESAIVTTHGRDGESTDASGLEETRQQPKAGSGLGALKAAKTTAAFRSSGPQTTLQDLAILYPELSDVIKSTAYNWATSLPRAMQASDEEVKQRALGNLQKAIAVLQALNIDSTTLQASLTAALRDSVVTLVLTSAPSKAAVNEAVSEDAILQAADTQGERKDLTLFQPGSQLVQSQPYRPILLSLGSQNGTREAVLQLIANVGPAAQQAKLAAEMLDFVRDSDGLDQVSAFWLAFELVKASFSKTEELDSFLDLSSFDDGGSESDVVFEDLYSFSVSALASHSDTNEYERDWRIGALALEVTAYAAARLKEAFRPELIDVLYPIATYLGSPEDRLRAHAVTTLNSLAASCGYRSVSELIIDNVDYMLNSVSLRLNTFDISPASTKVLTMMIRLAGPRLVPYLDDVVAAIFAALDNYHGYPLFVENLFNVLGEVVQQSVKSSTLLLEDAPSKGGPVRNLKRPPESSTTEDLLGILDRRAKRRKELDEDEDIETIRRGGTDGHLKRPWKATTQADKLLRKHEKQAKGGSDESEGEAEEDEDDEDEGGRGASDGKDEVSKPEDPKTPTYALLARITTLTQHYLTAPTPTLRKSLLDLLATVAPALAPDENAFLPLVNAIWPVVVTRLYDGEAYVVIAACHALAALCASAGDFLATRIKAEWHASLWKRCVRAKADAASKVSAPPSSRNAADGGRGFGTAPSNLRIGNRPSVIHIHGRASAGKGQHSGVSAAPADVVLPIRAGTPGDRGEQQQQQASSSSLALSSSSTTAATTTALTTSGLGRFAQAVQIWEALAGLLTAIVTYVKLDDDVFDVVLDLLLAPASSSGGGAVRVLPLSEEQKAREALTVVNPDAVWLARYRAGQLRLDSEGGEGSEGRGEENDREAWMAAQLPVLAGVQFVSLV